MKNTLDVPPNTVMREIKNCRLCLSRTPVVFSLLDAKIGGILEAVAAIQVGIEDHASTECCFKCLLNLKLAYRIRQGMIAAAERMLRGTSIASVKLECCSGDDLLETDSLCEDDGAGSCLSLSEQGDDAQVCKAVETELAYCALCSKSFKDLGSYDSHFSKCSFAKSEVQMGEYNQAEATESSSEDEETVIVKPIERDKKKEDTERKGKRRPYVITEDLWYQCEICPKKYPKKKLCTSHWYNIHKLKPCPICKKFYSASNLRRHLETHSTDSAKICDLCGKTFKNQSGLRQHKFYYHNSIRHKCEPCGKAFYKKIELTIHINKEHSDNPTLYICETCGKKFKDSYLLRTHILRMHERRKDFICKYCNKNFSTHNSLTTHTRQHTNETPYRCKVCGEGFRQHVSLKSHLKSKHEIEETKDVPCEVCGKKFATKHAVKTHMRLHQ